MSRSDWPAPASPGAGSRSREKRRRTRPGGRALEVLAGRVRRLRTLARRGPATRESAAAELLELSARGGLLSEHRGLDAVEEALEPSDELCLRDADLRF